MTFKVLRPAGCLGCRTCTWMGVSIVSLSLQYLAQLVLEVGENLLGWEFWVQLVVVGVLAHGCTDHVNNVLVVIFLIKQRMKGGMEVFTVISWL